MTQVISDRIVHALLVLSNLRPIRNIE